MALAVLCGFFFFVGLGSLGLTGADEPRYAQVAREMLQRHDLVTPTLLGKPWLEKPPLLYWQVMQAYSLFGIDDWVARFPAAVFALSLVVFLYLFIRRFRPGVEMHAAIITASC